MTEPLTFIQIQSLLDQAFPGSQLGNMSGFDDDHANLAHRLEVRLSTGESQLLVLKRYIGNGADRRARQEFTALKWLSQRGIPVPAPLFFGTPGTFFSEPCTLMSFVSGSQVIPPADALERMRWARQVAETLARVHAAPLEDGKDLLRDGNTEALWFMKSPGLPEYLRIHPEGQKVWDALQQHRTHLKPAPVVLLHTDYWSGNMLWQGEQISAILDWEEASYGDPGVDVAYCRMDMVLFGYPDAADEFLRIYQSAAGQSAVENLAFWELAAAVRPMYIPEGWISASPFIERFSQFVAGALSRLA